MKCKKTTRSGFTLLELMAVMLIMFMLMGMGTVAMKGMIQGTGISGATSNVRSVLTQARQYAVMKEQSVYVILENKDDKSSMTVCAKYGVCENNGFPGSDKYAGRYCVILEDPLPWGTNTLEDAVVYNLDRSDHNTGVIFDNTDTANGQAKIVMKSGGIKWGKGNGVGFEVAEKRYLPSGMTFKSLSNANNPIVFNSDGSPGSGYKVTITESLVANPATVDVEVEKLTGWVK